MGIKCGAIADLDFSFVDARKGAGALLDKDGLDIAKAKAVLQRLQGERGFRLGDNGLPAKSQEFTAAQVWSAMAADADGALIASEVHDALAAHGIWVWAQDCIEDVLGIDDKGEDVIQAQEERLLGLPKEALEGQMDQFKICVDWIAGL